MAKDALEVVLLRWGEGPDGRTVTFLLPEEGSDHPFKGLRTGRVNGQRLAMALAQINDDESEAPVEPVKARKRGGVFLPSNECAIVCTESTFWRFLEEKYPHIVHCKLENHKYADIAVKTICGIDSKTEFDTNPQKERLWRALKHQYDGWLGRSGHDD